jgi:hypothetical protein
MFSAFSKKTDHVRPLYIQNVQCSSYIMSIIGTVPKLSSPGRNVVIVVMNPNKYWQHIYPSKIIWTIHVDYAIEKLFVCTKQVILIYRDSKPKLFLQQVLG